MNIILKRDNVNMDFTILNIIARLYEQHIPNMKWIYIKRQLPVQGFHDADGFPIYMNKRTYKPITKKHII